MIAADTFLSFLDREGIRFFAGVPDSLLQSFCAEVSRSIPAERNVIAANEGSAIALAAGYYLGTGNAGCVYLQNSGLGNAVNPLTSLMDPEVYGIPVLMMIGWRGELVDGIQLKDEPQHVKQGRITGPMLDCLDIPYEILGAKTENPEARVIALLARMRNESRPVALVVRKDTFAAAKNPAAASRYRMTREDVLKALVDALPEDVIVVGTTGKTSRELYEIRLARGREPGHDFLTVGAMGHALQIACGLALARPERKVICIDGDGAFIMHMGGSTTAAAIPNLIHAVINNGAHDSVGGQPTKGFDIDMLSIARACGYGSVRKASDASEIDAAIRDAAASQNSSFVEICARTGARDNLGRPKRTPAEAKVDFMASLGEMR
ncbi:MAG: phosphonopyruvate decarboxylase [Proteobacteria bacterium]|nr:phosphonopyruvate decarboxylase [Pseudomonadota bacterium]